MTPSILPFSPAVHRVFLISLAITTFLTFLSLHDSDVLQHIEYVQNKIAGDKEVFIRRILNSSIDGDYDGKGLKQLCSSTQWRSGLVFVCEGIEGGIGNVRNEILNCVRFAIEAGAALVVPQVTARSQKDLSELKTNQFLDLGYFFDRPYFLQTLKEGCPQMRLYNQTSDLWGKSTTETILPFVPTDIVTKFAQGGHVLGDPELWRTSFDTWLFRNLSSLSLPEPSHNTPILVEISRSIFVFPTSHDSKRFVHNFGKILRFRLDIRRLAAVVLYELSQMFSLNIDPCIGIVPNSFMGVHLRTAIDALKMGWRGYGAQATVYMEQAVKQHLPIIYLASGVPADRLRFQSEASEKFGFNAMTKDDLLKGDDLASMFELTWDQQALIDYEVLLRSSHFVGIETSSFAWNIALRRHVVSKLSSHLAGRVGQTMDDEYSVIYGPWMSWDMIPASMWP